MRTRSQNSQWEKALNGLESQEGGVKGDLNSLKEFLIARPLKGRNYKGKGTSSAKLECTLACGLAGLLFFDFRFLPSSRVAALVCTFSLGDGVNVIIVGRVDLSVVAECCQGLVEGLIADAVLDDVPDVALVDELVLLGDLAHDFKDDLFAVSRELLEPLISGGVVITCCAHSV